jgi:mRNA interferase MazF
MVTPVGIRRGEVWWARLPEPAASEPGYRRPVLVVSSDEFNRSRIRTVLAAALTTNLRLAEAPGNVLVAAGDAGLPRDSVVNVSQIVTVDKSFLGERAGRIGARSLLAVENGLRLVLAL